MSDQHFFPRVRGEIALQHFSALLMAGGESRRMGQDKATLVVRGEPLWRRQVRTLQTVGFSEIMIARGAREPLGIGEPGLVAVADVVPSCGPLGGLAAGLQQVATRWLLVLAVDLPLMPTWFLRDMMAMVEDDLSERGLVPVHAGRREPLAAIYPAGPAAAAASQALQAGNLSLQALLDELFRVDAMREVPVLEANRDFFRNVNTPEDLAEIERLLAKA